MLPDWRTDLPTLRGNKGVKFYFNRRNIINFKLEWLEFINESYIPTEDPWSYLFQQTDYISSRW